MARRAGGACERHAVAVPGTPPNEGDKHQELDYRFTLANERTFLAWLRTGLAFLAAAVALAQLVPRFGSAPWHETLAMLLVALSITSSLGGTWRWRAVERAMRAGEPLPRSRLPWGLGLAFAVLGVGGAVTLVLGAR